MGKIDVYDQIVIENQKTRENMEIDVEIKDFFLHKSPYNRWYRNGIHSKISRADTRASDDQRA